MTERADEEAVKCDRCGGPATHEGWAFPGGGSFPVKGCEPCLFGLATHMEVQVRPLTRSGGEG